MSFPEPCLMYNKETFSQEHELGLRKFHLSPGAEPIEARMGREETWVRERQEKQHGDTIRNLVSLGSGQVTWDVNDAAEKLLERDYPEVASITATDPRTGLTGQNYIPDTFLSKCAPAVDAAAYTARMEEVKQELEPDVTKQKKALKDHQYSDFSNQLDGELTEKVFYNGAKRHFKQTKEEITLIHGAKLIMACQTSIQGDKFAEKDIIIINNTLQYVMNVEIKHNIDKKTVKLHAKSGVKQITEAKKEIQDYFGKELNQDWMFIGAMYGSSRVEGKNGFNVCRLCEDFVMVGPSEISAKLTKITERVRNSRNSSPVPSPMVYRTMTKYLLYCIHASPAAPVRGNLTRMVAKKVQEEQGSSKNIAFWARSLYTPTQHSLIRSEGLR